MALVSLLVIFGTLIVCDTLRGFLTKFDTSSSLRSRICLDVLVSIEFISVAFELGIILENYGLWIWLVGLYLNVMYQLIRWRGLTMPSPCAHFIGFMSGQSSFKEVAIRSFVILASGLATYHLFVAPMWSLELTSMHIGKPEATSSDSCTVPFHDVPVWQSVSAEFVGSLVLGVAPGLIVENPTLANNDPIYTVLLIGVLVLVVVVPVMGISGGMFNPLLATVLFGGCKGHSMAEHIFIYWVGALAGSVVAFMVYPSIKKMIYPVTKVEAEKKKN